MLFTDENGNKHDLAINIGNARKVLRLYDVDLMDVQSTFDKLGQHDEIKRTSNTMLMLDICFILAQSNAKKEIDEDEFYEALAGDSLIQLQEAFLGSLANFTPSLPMRRIIQKSLAMIQTTQADLLAKVEEADFSEVLKGGN